MTLAYLPLLLNIFIRIISIAAAIYIIIKLVNKDKKFHKNENTLSTTATITGIVNYRINFISNVYRYDYSFLVGDITYTGSYYQSKKDFNEKGRISNQQKVLYDGTDPSNNKLEIDEGLVDNRKIILVVVLVIVLFAVKYI